MRVAEAPRVALVLARTHSRHKAHALARPPRGRAVHRQIFRDDAADSRAAQQLGHRSAGVALLLVREEGHQLRRQRDRSFGPLASLRLQPCQTILGEGGSPSLDRADAHAAEPSVGSLVLSLGDGAHSSTLRSAGAKQRFDLTDHEVAEERLGRWRQLQCGDVVSHEPDNARPAPSFQLAKS